jgi:zinc transporter ZupT
MISGLDQRLSVDLFLSLFPDLIGCLGAILVLVAYTLLQMGKLSSNDILYSFLNFIAGFMILISLFYSWNLSAFVMEVSWMIISAYGIGKAIFSYKSIYEQTKS